MAISKTGGLFVAALVFALFLWGSVSAAGWFSSSGDVVEAQGVLEAADAWTPKDVSDQTRAAMLDGHPVRIRYAPEDGLEEQRDYWCRHLTERDISYALRQVSRVRKTTDEVFNLKEEDPVERERRMAELLRIRAMTGVVEQLIKDGRGFMTKGYVPSLQSDGEWHYWNLRVYYKDEGELILYAPIDLKQFPEVKDFRDRSRDIEQFAKTHRAYEWNALDYAARRKLVDAAIAAKSELIRLRREIDELRMSAGQPQSDERVRELRRGVQNCQDIISRAPPLVDQETLDWRFR